MPGVGRRVLANSLHMGHVGHGAEVYPGAHAAIVSEARWPQAAALRGATARTKGGRGGAGRRDRTGLPRGFCVAAATARANASPGASPPIGLAWRTLVQDECAASAASERYQRVQRAFQNRCDRGGGLASSSADWSPEGEAAEAEVARVTEHDRGDEQGGRAGSASQCLCSCVVFRRPRSS